MNLVILGAGAWGTALAIHLCRMGHRVTLVARRLEHALDMAQRRENRDYLPDYPLEPSLQVGMEVAPSVMEAEVVLLACPVKGLRSWLEPLAAALPEAQALRLVVTLCKGMEMGSQALPSDVVAELLPGMARGALSGPTYASEVAAGKPGAITLATDLPEADTLPVQEALSGPSLRVYRSADLTGVELAGALKNPYAVGAGICDGLKLGDNAKAAYLTRALAEMVRVGTALGGGAETFYGLSGFGDLMATANGGWSRNRCFGEAVGLGRDIGAWLNERRTVVEGYAATASLAKRCTEANIDAPILQALHAVLYQGLDPACALHELMSRPLRAESDRA